MLQNVYGTTWDSLVQKRLSCDGKAATIVVNDSSNEPFSALGNLTNRLWKNFTPTKEDYLKQEDDRLLT